MSTHDPFGGLLAELWTNPRKDTAPPTGSPTPSRADKRQSASECPAKAPENLHHEAGTTVATRRAWLVPFTFRTIRATPAWRPKFRASLVPSELDASQCTSTAAPFAKRTIRWLGVSERAVGLASEKASRNVEPKPPIAQRQLCARRCRCDARRNRLSAASTKSELALRPITKIDSPLIRILAEKRN